jgi:small subunit ribosomal protein S10
MAEKISIRLKSYDHRSLDQSAAKIVSTIKQTGAAVSGPVPLPNKKRYITVRRSVHKHSSSQEHFMLQTHKRLIVIESPTKKTIESLVNLVLPAGILIEIKL